MSETYPIKDKEALHSFRDYYKDANPNPRNYSLIVTGLNTAFRVGDLLKLQWQDVCHADGVLRKHICIAEQKTGKNRTVPINTVLRQTLDTYRSYCPGTAPQDFLFPSTRDKSCPLSRSQAYRIVKRAAENCGLSEHVGCHSLRKTRAAEKEEEAASSPALWPYLSSSAPPACEAFSSLSCLRRKN